MTQATSPVPDGTPSAGARFRRPGGRTAKNTTAVFDAVIEELASRRFEEVSIESIAIRAGVHKSTIYRRWESKSTLLVEALEAAAESRLDLPDTGRFRDDLEAVATSVVEMLVSREGAAVLNAYTAEAPHNSELRAVFRRFRDVRAHIMESVVAKAVARGEIPAGTDPARLLTSLLSPFYYEMLIEVRVPTPVLIRDAVEATGNAARDGVFADGPSGD